MADCKQMNTTEAGPLDWDLILAAKVLNVLVNQDGEEPSCCQEFACCNKGFGLNQHVFEPEVGKVRAEPPVGRGGEQLPQLNELVG